MKNLKLCLLASTAILTSVTIAYASDDDSNADCQSHCSGTSTPTHLTAEQSSISAEEKTKFHYEAHLSIAEKQKTENDQALQRIEDLKKEPRTLFSNEEAQLLCALEELRSAHHEFMSVLEQNTKDTKHEAGKILDISAYSQYIVTVLLGIEAFINDPKAEIDEATLFVAMKQLSESNLETLMRIQNTCSNMEQLKCDALSTVDTAKSCGLYAHVNEEVAKTNVMTLAHNISETRRLLVTFNADIQKKALDRKHQILATDEIKMLTAEIWHKANQTKPAQELLTDVMRILNGTFIPFSNYPNLPPELSDSAIGKLFAHHPKTNGITIQIARVLDTLKTSSLTTEETTHLSNLQQTITQGMSDLDAIRPETKLYKLMSELSSAVADAAKHQDDQLAETKTTIGTLLDAIKSREEFKILGLFVSDETTSHALIEQAEKIIA